MRHDTALKMPDERRPEVTQAMVAELWNQAIHAPKHSARIHDQAAALINQVNSENPVVNWGLTELHALTRGNDPSADILRRRRASWFAELERFGQDPDLWMRRYFQDMIRGFTKTHGADRGRAFAAKLVRDGHLTASDVRSSETVE